MRARLSRMPPRVSELLLGSFYDPRIYARAACFPAWRTFLLLAGVTALCGGLVTCGWLIPRNAALSDLAGSEIERLPSITVDETGLRCRRSGPEAFDAVHFVLWLELDSTRPSKEVISELLEPDERRPIVHISSEALVVYKRGETPRPLAWDGLVRREGAVTVTGMSIVDWLGDQLVHRAFDAWIVGTAAVFGTQFVVLLLLVMLWRMLHRSSRLRRPSGLIASGALAAIPPTVLGTGLSLAGLGPSGVAGVYLGLFGMTFLMMASRLNEAPDPGLALETGTAGPDSGDEELGTNPLGGVDRADLAAMKERGLLSDEDLSFAEQLLAGEDDLPCE